MGPTIVIPIVVAVGAIAIVVVLLISWKKVNTLLRKDK